MSIKFQIVSDLHLDYHRDGGETLVNEVSETESDYLIVAGDLSDAESTEDSLELLLAKIRVPIIFLSGTHEYFHSSIEKVDAKLRNFAAKHRKFLYLKNDTIKIGNINIGGTTLWYEYQSDNSAYYKSMYEFSCIENHQNTVYEENRKAKSFIDKNPNLDILITHHMPSEKCIDPRFKNSSVNRFFVCPMLDSMEESIAPKNWIYGHTHLAKHFQINNTNLICNPFGNIFENSGFDANLVITL